MKRRWVMLIELGLLLVVLVWVGFSLADFGHPLPPNSVSFKLQIRDTQSRIFLQRKPDGSMHYILTDADDSREELTPEQFSHRLFTDQVSRHWFLSLLNIHSPLGIAWITIGLLGQVLFTGRMVVQWLASEKQKASVVPPAFWWMSLVGSSMLLAYFLWRKDPVGVLGQAVGWFIYVRNLWLIYQTRTPGHGTVEAAQ